MRGLFEIKFILSLTLFPFLLSESHLLTSSQSLTKFFAAFLTDIYLMYLLALLCRILVVGKIRLRLRSAT